MYAVAVAAARQLPMVALFLGGGQEPRMPCVRAASFSLALLSESGYNQAMKIEWDPKKARSNLRKHRVSFEEAATAVSDPLATTGADPDHSVTEDRYVTFAVSTRGRLLVVAHTEEHETIRIISARLASKGERKLYEEG